MSVGALAAVVFVFTTGPTVRSRSGPAPGADLEMMGPEVEGGRVGKVQHSSFTFVWRVFRSREVENAKSTVSPP